MFLFRKSRPFFGISMYYPNQNKIWNMHPFSKQLILNRIYRFNLWSSECVCMSICLNARMMSAWLEMHSSFACLPACLPACLLSYLIIAFCQNPKKTRINMFSLLQRLQYHTPMSFEQALAMGRTGILPSPILNGYKQKGLGGGLPSGRHSDSDEEDWC